MLSDVAILDDLLGAHRLALGKDYQGYRNHTYRVLNLCAALSQPNAAQLEKIAVAAAFHDLGIWTAGTFDYLPPSMDLARHHLEGTGNPQWVPEVDAMILEHHKCTAYTANRHGWWSRSARPTGSTSPWERSASDYQGHCCERSLPPSRMPAFMDDWCSSP